MAPRPLATASKHKFRDLVSNEATAGAVRPGDELVYRRELSVDGVARVINMTVRLERDASGALVPGNQRDHVFWERFVPGTNNWERMGEFSGPATLEKHILEKEHDVKARNSDSWQRFNLLRPDAGGMIDLGRLSVVRETWYSDLVAATSAPAQ